MAGLVVPRAGVDYPATWPAFESWFRDEAPCRTYLAGLRWPDGFRCPSCEGAKAWETARGHWMCEACGHQSSVTAQTIFHRSRYPLSVWFKAMWLVCSSKNGTSALELQRQLGLRSYETAWVWLHKLRRAMVRPDHDRLGGPGLVVELDETYIGGRAHPSPMARYDNKTEVVIAVERHHPKGLDRARMRTVDNGDRKIEIFDFAADVIAADSVLHTDGTGVHKGIATTASVIHEPIEVIHTADPAHAMLPAVHRVAALLKRWLAGTLQHGQSTEHLDYYLDEFTFRFNHRNNRSRGLLFHRLCEQAVNTDPHPLHDLTTTTSDQWS